MSAILPEGRDRSTMGLGEAGFCVETHFVYKTFYPASWGKYSTGLLCWSYWGSLDHNTSRLCKSTKLVFFPSQTYKPHQTKLRWLQTAPPKCKDSPSSWPFLLFLMLEQARATRIQLPLPKLFPTHQFRSETMHVVKTVFNKRCSDTLCLHHSCTCFVNACKSTSDGYPTEKRLSTVIWNLFCDNCCETLPLLRSSALESSAGAHLYKGVIELMCR